MATKRRPAPGGALRARRPLRLGGGGQQGRASADAGDAGDAGARLRANRPRRRGRAGCRWTPGTRAEGDRRRPGEARGLSRPRRRRRQEAGKGDRRPQGQGPPARGTSRHCLPAAAAAPVPPVASPRLALAGSPPPPSAPAPSPSACRSAAPWCPVSGPTGPASPESPAPPPARPAAAAPPPPSPRPRGPQQQRGDGDRTERPGPLPGEPGLPALHRQRGGPSELTRKRFRGVGGTASRTDVALHPVRLFPVAMRSQRAKAIHPDGNRNAPTGSLNINNFIVRGVHDKCAK